jgi:hypothetical protein
MPRLVDRLGGEVTLHLALVAAEVRQAEEQPANQSRPQGVGLAQVEPGINRLQPSGCTSELQRLAEADLAGDAVDQDADRRQHPDDDHDHLLDVGPGHRLDAAKAGVDHHRHRQRQHGRRHAPAENRGDHHCRRRQRNAQRERPSHQEQEAGQRSHPHIEALFEILVGGVDPRPGEERHHRERQDDHRDRQAEIELHEPQPGGIRLAGGSDQRHRAHLGRHHREADRPPGQRPVGEEVALDLVGALGAP